MTKKDLIQDVADMYDRTRCDVAEVVDGVLSTIGDALAEGDQVAITGFGTFSVLKRAARKGRNPSTGKSIQIAASNTPKFKPGKALKEAVNS